MDLVTRMMAWEEGELGEEETIALFQELINTRIVWQLQGCYGRMAVDLIDSGYCSLPDRAGVSAHA